MYTCYTGLYYIIPSQLSVEKMAAPVSPLLLLFPSPLLLQLYSVHFPRLVSVTGSVTAFSDCFLWLFSVAVFCGCFRESYPPAPLPAFFSF